MTKQSRPSAGGGVADRNRGGGGPVAKSEFPKQLRKLRELRRLSRRVLAELCGISKSALSRYERGERVPTLTDAEALADFFEVSIDRLCGREK